MKSYLLIGGLLFFGCQTTPNSKQTNNKNIDSIHSTKDNDQDQQYISFEKIEYASFEQSKQKNNIRIGLYYRIDTTGLVTIRHDDDYHDTLTFNTYQLSTSQLRKINSIFNPAGNLKQYIIKTKYDEDEFFEGPYKYFSVTYKDSSMDSLCFIVPFMSDDFQDVYHMLDSIHWADKLKLKTIPPFSITESFKVSVSLNYKKSGLPDKKSITSLRLEDQKK